MTELHLSEGTTSIVYQYMSLPTIFTCKSESESVSVSCSLAMMGHLTIHQSLHQVDRAFMLVIVSKVHVHPFA